MTKGYTIQSRFGHYPYASAREMFLTRRENFQVTQWLWVVTGYDYLRNDTLRSPILIFLN